jgi:hypothetical protein
MMWSSVHIVRYISDASSVGAPRSSKGTPRASNSVPSPVAVPSTTPPLLNWSTLADNLATSIGLRVGKTRMDVPIRRVFGHGGDPRHGTQRLKIGSLS